MLRRLFTRGLTVGATLVGAELAYAVLRPSPYLPEFDPSSDLGSPDNPELRIAVLGDSSVTAPGVAGPEEIWVSIVANRLAETHHVKLRSFAVGGSMAHNLIEDQLEPAILFGPDLILVSVGANDALKGVPIRRFASSLDRLIAELSDTGAIVVQSGVGDLGTIPRLYPPLSTMVSKRALKFDRVHWDVAWRYGTTVVHQRDDDLELWTSDLSLWSPDLFHVNGAGHARWAMKTWDVVEPLLEDL